LILVLQMPIHSKIRTTAELTQLNSVASTSFIGRGVVKMNTATTVMREWTAHQEY